MKTLKLARIAAATVALVAGGAHAALITSWDISDVAFFDPTTVTPTGASIYSPKLSNANTTLRWGDPYAPNTQQSGLDIDSQSFTGVSLGQLVNTVSVTHLNFPIEAPFLTAVDILATISLTPTVAIPGFPVPLVSGTTTFKVKFFETPNGGSNGVCADGNAVGVGLNVAGCADIFVVDKETPLDFSFIVPDYDGLGDIEYFVKFSGTGFTNLSAAACSSLGVAAGCTGFLTEENKASDAVFGLTITGPQGVPEPGSLALLGLGLLGLGAVRRHKSVK